MPSRHRLRVILIGAAIAAASAPAHAIISTQATPPGAVPGRFIGTITTPPGRTNIVVVDGRSVSLGSPELRDRLAAAEPGDRLTATVDDVAQPRRIVSVQSLDRQAGGVARLVALLLAASILLAAAAATTRMHPQRYLLGVDGLYSNSQVQLALWFGTVATTYGAFAMLRAHLLGMAYIGDISIPDHVLALTGLSAFTFGSAKAIAASKTATPADAAAAAAVAGDAAEPSLTRDLVTNNLGSPDMGDFQMIVISVAAAAIFLCNAFNQFEWLSLTSAASLPDVDGTLLAGFGLGQGAYLFKKAALPKNQG